MKKRKKIFFPAQIAIVFSVAVALFFGTAIGVDHATSRLVHIGDLPVHALEPDDAEKVVDAMLSSKRIKLVVEGSESLVSLHDLGISFDKNALLAELDEKRFGFASTFAYEASRIAPMLLVDKEKFKATILRLFPFLQDQELAHKNFFEDSDTIPVKTFDVDSAVASLTFDAMNLRASTVEIPVITNRPKISRRLQEITPLVTAVAPSSEVEKSPVAEQMLSEEERLRRREELKARTLVLRVDEPEIELSKFEWKIPLKDGLWVLDSVNGVEINPLLLEAYLKEQIMPRVYRPASNATIKRFEQNGKAVQAEVEGFARDGVDMDFGKNFKLIKEKIEQGIFEIKLEVFTKKSYVYNDSGLDLGNLELLSMGRSNFKGSPEGRKQNIKKGLGEKITNIVVPPGERFAFNGFLGPITASRGWKEALGIFGGGALRKTPGGGLCQVSTTVYRAALYAGLPIEQRKAHSLYVHYYKEYGDGLDATIFSTGPNLVFRNDTQSWIFVQSYVENDDAYVKVFGTKDGREVAMNGPFRFHNAPEEKGVTPRGNEILWFRTVKTAAGEVFEDKILSRYKTLPKG